MRKIEEFIGKEIIWKLTRLRKREYSLQFNNEGVATFNWPKLLNQTVVIKTAEYNWQITPVRNSFEPRYSLNLVDSSLELAKINYVRSIIELSSGKKFYLKSGPWWKEPIYSLMDQEGKQNIRFNFTRTSFFRVEKHLFIDQNIAIHSECSLLVITAVYLRHLNESSGGAS